MNGDTTKRAGTVYAIGRACDNARSSYDRMAVRAEKALHTRQDYRYCHTEPTVELAMLLDLIGDMAYPVFVGIRHRPEELRRYDELVAVFKDGEGKNKETRHIHIGNAFTGEPDGVIADYPADYANVG